MDELNQLFKAVESGNIDQVERLITTNPDLKHARNQAGVSALLWALYNGQAAIAKRLAEGRSDLDVFEAAALGKVERLAEILENNRQQSTAWTPDGFQPLGLACFFRQPAAARLLLEAGADVNSPSQNPARVAPLHSAAAADQAEIVLQLLRRGANVNARQGGDFTPLHSAAQNGNLEMIKLLLVYGADPETLSGEGKMAGEYALDGGHTAAADLLQAARKTRRVVLRPYDPTWPALFRAEASRLIPVLEPLLSAIYHIGSTSVPGLLSKPTVDILVEVTNLDRVESLNSPLEQLGYVARGENGIPGRRYFFLAEGNVHKVHMHIFQIGNPEIERHLAFRDYLRRHPDIAQAYADLKEESALRFPLDPDGYTDAKEAFVREIDRLAAEEGKS